MPVIPSSGAARARVGYRPLAYTVASGYATGLDPAYPVARMAELRYFQRSTRSLPGAEDVHFALDFGADVTVAALSFEHLNFPAMALTYGTAAAPDPTTRFAESAPGQGTIDTSGIDVEDGRQKVLVVPPAPVTLRYLDVQALGVPTTGTAYAIGSLGAWGELVALYKNPGTPYRKVYEDTYDGSTSPVRCRITFPARLRRADLAAVEQFLAMARAPRERVMLWDENEGDLAKWYHVQRDGTAESVRQAGPYLELNGLELRQVGARADDA